jgi:flagellar motor switch/type III secretory pathway protein FliN
MASAQTAEPRNQSVLAQSPSGQANRVAPAAELSGQQRQSNSPGNQLAVAPQSERNLTISPTSIEHADQASTATGFGPLIARLPVQLDVAIPLREFRVRNLLSLEPGRLIESEWSNGLDLPLSAGAVQLAWSEFEVMDTNLVVRLTRLA